MGSRGRSRAGRQGAWSGAGTGRAVLEGSGSDASRHAYPLHSTIEGAHCARSWLWTIARRSIVGRPGKIKAIEELGSGLTIRPVTGQISTPARRRSWGSPGALSRGILKAFPKETQVPPPYP